MKGKVKVRVKVSVKGMVKMNRAGSSEERAVLGKTEGSRQVLQQAVA
jgi:hypothetical protein